MELNKIRDLSDDQLKTDQAKAGEQLFRIRFQKSLGNQEGIKKLRGLKLDIARIQTIARERALAEESKANPVAKNAAPAKSTRTARHKAAVSAAKSAAENVAKSASEKSSKKVKKG